MPKSIEEYLDELKSFSSRSKFKDTAIPSAAPVTDNSGGLVMIVTHAQGTFPVVNATITIRDENSNTVITTKTDQSGRSERIVLPTLSKDLSEQPTTDGSAVALFYDAQIDAENFVSVLIKNIPIYEGVTSLQSYDMTYRGAVSNTDMQIIELPKNNV